MTGARRFAAPPGGQLTEEMQAAFADDGFLILDGFASAETTAALRARTAELIAGFDPDSVRSVFAAGAGPQHRDAWFRGSGREIRFFFEAGAFDDAGRLTRDKAVALNKIGHALHDFDPVFAGFSRAPELAAVAEGLGLVDADLVQSMLILKPPAIGGAVDMHQDATFLHTEPVSVIGFWLALEDATPDNGGLVAIPGGHRGGLKARHHYAGADLVTTRLDDTPFAGDPVPLLAPEGTLVVLHGLLPHGSGPNLSPRPRAAFALHAVDRRARWSADNWLQLDPARPTRGFRP
ncbi:phytanoyl-CoA dioxygenase family protein [Segnochrobactraceae bacterium EtOH-i3]